MSSIKECTLAFFKGLAFGKGLIMGRELAENKDMAEDRWITIHPFGNMKQGEADTGEGKRYYQRIFINDETDEIEGGLGGKLNGTKIKDLGKKLKELRDKKGGKSEGTGQTETKKTEENDNLSDLAKKIKALTKGKEYTEEVANKVGDLLRQELLKNKEFKAIIDNATDRNDEAICKEWGKLYKESLHVDKDYQGTLDEIQRVKEEIFQKYGKTWTAYAYIENDKRIKSLERKSKKIRNDLYESARQDALSKHGFSLEQQREKTKKIIGIIRDSLKDVIDFNNGNNFKSTNKEIKKSVDIGLGIYSQEHMDLMEQSRTTIKTISGRASYVNALKEVRLSKTDDPNTASHEFAHLLEHINPRILQIEQEFYDRRTAGGTPVKLKSLYPNSNYRSDEITIVDNFSQPYSGKIYKDRRTGKQDAFELLSVGVEQLVNEPQKLAKDPDYMNFVLGCLACKG